MIKALKKLANARKANRLAKHRKTENHRQLQQIYAGIIERGL